MEDVRDIGVEECRQRGATLPPGEPYLRRAAGRHGVHGRVHVEAQLVQGGVGSSGGRPTRVQVPRAGAASPVVVIEGSDPGWCALIRGGVGDDDAPQRRISLRDGEVTLAIVPLKHEDPPAGGVHDGRMVELVTTDARRNRR